ncbi:hypothetical protein DPEC_G00341500 [Dallia pectoralis]|uniref:Uncharacterized protein n=1 Tax=Dallia pectoralis TaxID=75939 RepID=A0ACC2F5T6_DALPE|nr:hypothetical protein DPEC_G00341500 [Dallia pectoralis]
MARDVQKSRAPLYGPRQTGTDPYQVWCCRQIVCRDLQASRGAGGTSGAGWDAGVKGGSAPEAGRRAAAKGKSGDSSYGCLGRPHCCRGQGVASAQGREWLYRLETESEIGFPKLSPTAHFCCII